MPGTHYTLDRDKDSNKNPMDLIKEKACGRCHTVKPNDFRFFGKKLWKTRTDLTTNDICIVCQKAKVSQSMRDRWKSRKSADEAYEAERHRQARAVFEANEAIRKRREAEAAEDSAVRALRIQPVEQTEIQGPMAVEVIRPSDDAPVVGERAETESERLMRELLSKS